MVRVVSDVNRLIWASGRLRLFNCGDVLCFVLVGKCYRATAFGSLSRHLQKILGGEVPYTVAVSMWTCRRKGNPEPLPLPELDAIGFTGLSSRISTRGSALDQSRLRVHRRSSNLHLYTNCFCLSPIRIHFFATSFSTRISIITNFHQCTFSRRRTQLTRENPHCSGTGSLISRNF